jgi:hypothetical protein
MTYISKEAQEVIDELEQRLNSAEESRKNAEENDKSRGSQLRLFRSLTISLFLLLIAAVVIGYVYYTQTIEPQLKGDMTLMMDLQTEVDSLRNVLDLQAPENGVRIDYSTGKWYFVQIGAYKNLDLSLYEEGMVNFRQTEAEDLHKYSIGAFQDLDLALEFLEKVRRIGIRDAFLLATVNGERVTIAESQNH